MSETETMPKYRSLSEALARFSVDDLVKCRESILGDDRKIIDLEISKRMISQDVRRAS